MLKIYYKKYFKKYLKKYVNNYKRIELKLLINIKLKSYVNLQLSKMTHKENYIFFEKV